MSHDTEVYDGVRRTPLFSVAQSAEYLNCSRRTIERLIAKGDLVPLHVASRRRLRIEDLDAYAERKPAP